ncbi:MAG: DUF3500 domain-containing protein [Chloroflexi bacterium]|nr:DUF3500 domain-containing protein [Chloroflexota bacterium]
MTATVIRDLSTSDRAPATAGRMASAALDFLASLNDMQHRAATLPFGDDRRYIWDYRPPESTPRNGLRLINMTREQQAKALALLDIGLSTRGAEQVRQIIDLETPLLESEREEGRVTPFVRHPEHYAVCVFGDPSSRAPWAWHVGGHHVGLHFTVVDGDQIASVPLFFGANPAEVRHGPTAGQRTLPEVEDMARALVRALPADQQQVALVSATAFPDILTDKYRVANAFAPPRGLPAARMSGEHRGLLSKLVRHYVERTNAELSGQYWPRIEAELDGLTFAWAGSLEPGQGHYYAIKGPSFLIEYDNTQNEANHIHSVLRDIRGDWGEDLLARHYAEAHRAAIR